MDLMYCYVLSLCNKFIDDVLMVDICRFGLFFVLNFWGSVGLIIVILNCCCVSFNVRVVFIMLFLFI